MIRHRLVDRLPSARGQPHHPPPTVPGSGSPLDQTGISWGSTYAVTTTWLPPDRPLFSPVVRALPVGLLIMAVTRSRPHGRWWLRSLVLGGINIALFFALLFAAAYRLPSGVASSITARSPLAVMIVAFGVLGERTGVRRVLAGVVRVSGVLVLVWQVCWPRRDGSSWPGV